jgi:hypothetical protein
MRALKRAHVVSFTVVLSSGCAGEPVAITGDDKGLYWVTYRTGTVWKIAKP